MTRTITRRSVAAAMALALLAGAPTAQAAGELPIGLPDGLPGELPPLPELPGTGDVPVDELTGDVGGVLPGTPSGTSPGSETGAQPGAGSPAGSVDTAGLDPVISGPSRASTVRVDSKGRFRVAGVAVACPVLSPDACAVAVRVTGATGSKQVKFVTRSFSLRPGATLQLKKLKVSKKGLRALRATGVARVLAAVSAARPGGVPAQRAIGLKLKPAKR